MKHLILLFYISPLFFSCGQAEKSKVSEISIDEPIEIPTIKEEKVEEKTSLSSLINAYTQNYSTLNERQRLLSLADDYYNNENFTKYSDTLLDYYGNELLSKEQAVYLSKEDTSELKVLQENFEIDTKRFTYTDYWDMYVLEVFLQTKETENNKSVSSENNIYIAIDKSISKIIAVAQRLDYGFDMRYSIEELTEKQQVKMFGADAVSLNNYLDYMYIGREIFFSEGTIVCIYHSKVNYTYAYYVKDDKIFWRWETLYVETLPPYGEYFYKILFNADNDKYGPEDSTDFASIEEREGRVFVDYFYPKWIENVNVGFDNEEDFFVERFEND